MADERLRVVSVQVKSRSSLVFDATSCSATLPLGLAPFPAS